MSSHVEWWRRRKGLLAMGHAQVGLVARVTVTGDQEHYIKKSGRNEKLQGGQ